MTLGNRLAFGYDASNRWCVGLHVHPDNGEVMVDFFGFYLNACLGSGEAPGPITQLSEEHSSR